MGGVWCALVGILNSGSQLMISGLTLVCSSKVEITLRVLNINGSARKTCKTFGRRKWDI